MLGVHRVQTTKDSEVVLKDKGKKKAHTYTHTMLQQFEPLASDPDEGLTFVSYNVAYNNSIQNWQRIASYLLQRLPVVVCLQEVTFHARDIITSALGESLYWCKSGIRVESWHDTMMLVRKDATQGQPVFTTQQLGHSTHLRTIISCNFIAIRGDYIISCATAHLESEFFEKRCTQKKIKQLEQVRDQLVLHMSESDNKYRQQLAFYMGDTNLTGAEELQRENAGIAQLGFTDMWKVVRGDMFDHTEQQNSKSFCAQDCTWCAPENPTILKLQLSRWK